MVDRYGRSAPRAPSKVSCDDFFGGRSFDVPVLGDSQPVLRVHVCHTSFDGNPVNAQISFLGLYLFHTPSLTNKRNKTWTGKCEVSEGYHHT